APAPPAPPTRAPMAAPFPPPRRAPRTAPIAAPPPTYFAVRLFAPSPLELDFPATVIRYLRPFIVTERSSSVVSFPLFTATSRALFPIGDFINAAVSFLLVAAAVYFLW